LAGPVGIGLLAAKFLDLKKIGESVSNTLSKALGAVGNVIEGVGNVFKSIFGAGSNIIAGIGNVIGGLTNAIASLGGLISAGGKKDGEITDWLKLIKNIDQETTNKLTVMKTKTSHMVGQLNNLAGIKAFTGTTRERLGTISSIARDIRNYTKDMADYLKNLSGFQGGGTFTVPKATAIVVHPRELISITPLGAGGNREVGAKVEVNINGPLISTTSISRTDLERVGDELFQIIKYQAKRAGGEI